MARRLFLRRTDGQQFEHLPPRNARLSPPVLTQEALRLSKSLSQLLGTFGLSGLYNIPQEDYNFEFRVSRTEILKFVWSGVGG